jgi:hypothetical protein
MHRSRPAIFGISWRGFAALTALVRRSLACRTSSVGRPALGAAAFRARIFANIETIGRGLMPPKVDGLKQTLKLAMLPCLLAWSVPAQATWLVDYNSSASGYQVAFDEPTLLTTNSPKVFLGTTSAGAALAAFDYNLTPGGSCVGGTIFGKACATVTVSASFLFLTELKPTANPLAYIGPLGDTLTFTPIAGWQVTYSSALFGHVVFDEPTLLATDSPTNFVGTSASGAPLAAFEYNLTPGAFCFLGGSGGSTPGQGCADLAYSANSSAKVPLAPTANPFVYSDTLGGTLTFTPLGAVPEPASLALLAGGVITLGAARRGRRGVRV